MKNLILTTTAIVALASCNKGDKNGIHFYMTEKETEEADKMLAWKIPGKTLEIGLYKVERVIKENNENGEKPRVQLKDFLTGTSIIIYKEDFPTLYDELSKEVGILDNITIVSELVYYPDAGDYGWRPYYPYYDPLLILKEETTQEPLKEEHKISDSITTNDDKIVAINDKLDGYQDVYMPEPTEYDSDFAEYDVNEWLYNREGTTFNANYIIVKIRERRGEIRSVYFIESSTEKKYYINQQHSNWNTFKKIFKGKKAGDIVIIESVNREGAISPEPTPF